MAKIPMKADAAAEPMAQPRAQISRAWDKGVGSRIAGEAMIAEMDQIALAMEAKWGVDRLRLVVPADYRAAFDRQRYLVNQAIWHGPDLETLRVACAKMVLAYQTLDAKADADKVARKKAAWLETATSDGTVIVILLDEATPQDVPHNGRKIAFWTLDEIGEYLSHENLVNKCKEVWAGAKVVKTRPSLDPLASVVDSRAALDDEIPF